MKVPWSKEHKKNFKGIQFSLSNSFAEPLSHPELVELTKARNDQALLDDYVNHSLVYTPYGGSEDLKQEISLLYGPTITADNILVCAGGQAAVQLAAQAFARNGHSIVFTPGYQSTIESPSWALNSTGVTQIKRQASQQWQINIEEVEQTIRDHDDIKYMVINEPHNPSGIVMDSAKQQELIALCQKHDIIILSDEVYRLLEHDANSDRIPAMADAYSSGGISCVSMSKPWGACGISVGWLACPNKEMIQQLVDCQYFSTGCIGRASEIQAMMVLRASDTILHDRINIIRKNKALLQDVIEKKYPDLFEWERPNAGAIAFVKFKGPLTSSEFGVLLAERRISIKPAYCFSEGDVRTELEDYFRVGFGERKMPFALDALIATIEELKDEWKMQKHKQHKNDDISCLMEAFFDGDL